MLYLNARALPWFALFECVQQCWTVSHFLVRSAERKCYSVEQEASFKAIVHSRSWVRNSVNCDSNSIAVIILTQITVLCAGLTGKGDSVKYMKANLKLWFDQACFVCLLTFSSRQDGTCLLIIAHMHSTLSRKFAYVSFGKARQLVRASDRQAAEAGSVLWCSMGFFFF